MNFFSRKKNVIIFGGTGQALLLRPLIEEQGYRIIALFDKNKDNIPQLFSDIPLLYENEYDRFIREWYIKNRQERLYFVIAICNPHGRFRINLHNKLTNYYNLQCLNIIDKSAHISKSAIIGDGVQILAHANIMERAQLGEQCIIDTNATIEHECILGNATNVSPSAVICGLVTIGTNVWIGANATILPRIKIGDDVIIGAGSVVTKNIENNSIVKGNPAKFYKKFSEKCII